jgi:hypothetical protein
MPRIDWSTDNTVLTQPVPDVPLASPENLHPENPSVDLKARTFLITLSPKTDLTDDTIEEFKNYIKKKTQYAYIVTETGDNGKKHLHCCAVWSMDVHKRNIHDYWSKKMTQEYPGSIGRYAVKVTVQYDHKWYDEYLRKGGDVIYDEYDRDAVTKFFPSAEKQARLIELKGATPEMRVHILDQMLAEWLDKEPNDSSYESAIRFVKYRMYVENKTPYYVDNRKLCQACWFMYEKRNQIVQPNAEEINYGSRMTCNGLKF